MCLIHSPQEYQEGVSKEVLVERLALRKPYEKPNKRSREQFKPSRDEADQMRLFRHFDVQEFCYNFEMKMIKGIKDVSKSQMMSTTTCTLVAEQPIFFSENPKLMDSLMICEDNCDLPSLESDLMINNEQTITELTFLQPEHPSSLILFSQDFAEEPFDYSHQKPLLGTRIPLDDDLGPIFDEEYDHGPIFDEEAPSMTSIIMENQLCFDPGTSPIPLSTEHCKKPVMINSLPEMFVTISSQDVKLFGLDMAKEFCVSNSVFENMINSFKLFEPDKLSDQERFQYGNDIHYGLFLSFDQFLKHSKGFDHLKRPWHVLRSLLNNCVVLSFDNIMVYNTFFDKHIEPLISDSQSELTLLSSGFEKDMHAETCATCSREYDHGILVSVLSVQDKQVQSQRNVRNKSIDRAYQHEIWGCIDTYLAELDELNNQESWNDIILDEPSWTNTHLDELMDQLTLCISSAMGRATCLWYCCIVIAWQTPCGLRGMSYFSGSVDVVHIQCHG
ncbi:hypothetical protein F2Q68_00038549 [Brassica cretica]|uniref:Uncharacterized protein n=1 Tax=Brassica cretica TaxID=69181 RepID=A0A8S9MEN7_BRACR|nr:hypothetical protein F2Q68_00038549 [Brassica cretica]